MKCIMCNKETMAKDSVWIQAYKSRYKICYNCLKKYVPIKCRKNEIYRKYCYVQDKVIERLNEI